MAPLRIREATAETGRAAHHGERVSPRPTLGIPRFREADRLECRQLARSLADRLGHRVGRDEQREEHRAGGWQSASRDVPELVRHALQSPSNPGGTRPCRAGRRGAGSARRPLGRCASPTSAHTGEPPAACRRRMPAGGRGGRHRARPWRTGRVAPRVQPRTLPRERPAHRRAAAMILPAGVSPGGNSRALTAATAPFRQQTNP